MEMFLALQAVLNDISKRQIPMLLHLGDSVGYGPEPEETVIVLQEERVRSIQGCWDKSIAENLGDCGCEFINDMKLVVPRNYLLGLMSAHRRLLEATYRSYHLRFA